jgi:hypothetical protein
MDILVLLLFVGALSAWGIWVTLRTEERKEAAGKKDQHVARRPDTAHESDGSA